MTPRIRRPHRQPVEEQTIALVPRHHLKHRRQLKVALRARAVPKRGIAVLAHARHAVGEIIKDHPPRQRRRPSLALEEPRQQRRTERCARRRTDELSPSGAHGSLLAVNPGEFTTATSSSRISQPLVPNFFSRSWSAQVSA